MTRKYLLVLGLLLTGTHGTLYAYEYQNHFDMSSEAAKKSALGQTGMLANLGFVGSLDLRSGFAIHREFFRSGNR